MRRALIALLVFGTMAGCGSPSAPTPPPPVVEPLALSCPADIALVDVIGQAAVVNYATPQATGGSAPVTVACTPPSGSAFPLGTTQVGCTATDQASRMAVCAFLVSLTPVPVIGATRFLAFGDSLTAGEVSVNVTTKVLDPASSYPTVLRQKLAARFKGQAIVVTNEGLPGESAEKGQDRLPVVLAQHQPQVLLLLQGVIDLTQQQMAGIPVVIDALRADIDEARARGVPHIFLSTLLPQKEGEKNQAMPYIPETNDQIRALAVSEGVHLVDGYAAIAGREATLVGADGLHLTREGYEVLATAFYDRIRAVLETPAGAAFSPLRRTGLVTSPLPRRR